MRIHSSDPLTSMVNTGTASTVSETANGSSIDVSSTGLVTVTDPLGNVSAFAITDLQLNLTDLGANDTIDIAGNNPFTNGIFVDGDASFTDVINYTAGSDAAVTVNPSTATISQTGGGAVVYAGIQSVNLIASGSTSTLTVEALARGESLDFTQTGAGAGSFTFVGTGVAADTAPAVHLHGLRLRRHRRRRHEQPTQPQPGHDGQQPGHGDRLPATSMRPSRHDDPDDWAICRPCSPRYRSEPEPGSGLRRSRQQQATRLTSTVTSTAPGRIVPSRPTAGRWPPIRR